MVSVADILELPELAEAQVVAGAQGLHQPVTWAHNASVPDAADWLNGGEFVITTIINMPETPAAQAQYIRDMAKKGVAALAISTGRQLDSIPEHLRAAADAHGLPLIDISYRVRFVNVIKQINERIAEENMTMVRRALHINHTLTQLVLEGGTLEHLAQRLTDLLEHSISIETERFEAIATRNIAEVDEARRYTQLFGRTAPQLVEALETRGVLPRIRDTLRPVHIPPMPDVGLEMERILAPIVVHGEIYGFMWIIADDHNISELDMMAIESGAMIAALMILYQESVQSAEASLKGSLLSRLIQGDGVHETILTDQSLRYGVDLRSAFAMLLVECDNLSVQQIYRRLNQLVAAQGLPAVVGQFAGQVIVLMQATQDLEEVAKLMQDRLRFGQGAEASPRIGISRVQRGASSVHAAHEQCLDVLQIARRLQPQAQVVYFSDLGYLHALYKAGIASLQGNPYVEPLRKLLAEKQIDLFASLEAYLDSGANGVATADKLHVHRSTLNYRLSRVEQICGVRLQDPTVRTNLQVALKLLRLFEVDI